MGNDEDLVVSGSTPQEVSRSLTKAVQAQSPGLRKKLRAILFDYIGRYGEPEEIYARFNNDRTVRQIIDEYRPSDVEPLASGKVDGNRFALFDAPPAAEPDSE